MLTLHGIPNCETVKKARAWPYRKLDAALTHDLDARKAVALMIEYPSSIRRPIVTGKPRLLVGFKPAEYEAAFG